MATRQNERAESGAGGKKGRARAKPEGDNAPDGDAAPESSEIAPDTRKKGAVPKRDRGRPSSLLDTRVVYCGDNLEQLAKLPDACVDLIYIDPPFNSNRNYEVFWGESKEKRSFDDRHESTQAYIDYMRPRCQQLARVLKPTGSFYYHCDWHASHYVKVMLDQMFGENNFRNEIVWHYGGRGAKAVASQFARNHDVIFFYGTKKEGRVFNKEYLKRRYTPEEAKKKGFRKDEDGRWFKTSPRGDYTDESVARLRSEGRIHDTETGGIRIKYFLEVVNGEVIEEMLVGDTWTDIPDAMHMGHEKLGYPTQKPLALLERIINASSNKNDIVLDAFCGCGTALVAAQNLGRQWIGIDISPTACRVMAKRLRDVCRMRESEPGHRAQDPNSFIVRDLPWTEKKLREIPPFEFENWAVIALGGIPNKVQVGDMGIDGRLFPVGTKPADQNNMFAGDWFPIQVKQMDKVGRPDIDSFEAVMHREDRAKGFVVAFSFTADAIDEAASFYRKTKRLIKLFTVQDILDGDHVQKM